MSVDSSAIQAKHLRDMRGKPIDGLVLKEMVMAGLTWLRTNQQTVNALNVFPVPDGDTGTNMTLTMQSAWNEIAELGTRQRGRDGGSGRQGRIDGGARQLGRDPFAAVARVFARVAWSRDHWMDQRW